MSLGQRIARLRQERDLTLQDVANGAGLTPSFLSRLERDQVNISVANLRKLAQFFGIPMTYFFEGEETGSVARLVQTLAQPDAEQLTEVQRYPLTPPTARFEAQLVKAPQGGSDHSDDSELIYVVSGRLHYRLDDETYSVGAGEALLVRRGRPRRWECLEQTIMLLIRSVDVRDV